MKPTNKEIHKLRQKGMTYTEKGKKIYYKLENKKKKRSKKNG